MADKSDVTVGANKQRSSKRLILVVGSLVVLLIAGGVGWFVQREEPKPVSKVPQYTEHELLDEVHKKLGKRQYQQAIDLIKGQRSINETNTQILLAAAYENKGDHQSALTIYDQLEAEGKLDETHAATAADIAEHAQQYRKAIDFYKKAKERAPADATDQRDVYDYKIAELEKKL